LILPLLFACSSSNSALPTDGAVEGSPDVHSSADAEPADAEPADTVQPSLDGSADAGAAVSEDAAIDGGQPSGTCPGPIGAFPESEYFRPPHAFTRGACSATEIATLTQPGHGSFPMRRAAVGQACQRCVFSEYADPEWGLVVVVDPDTGLSNYAACYTTAGVTNDCPKLSNAWRFCARKACIGCASGAINACSQHEVESGQCKTFFDRDTNECNVQPPAPCDGDIFTIIGRLCGP
jgi:hypothetical protein